MELRDLFTVHSRCNIEGLETEGALQEIPLGYFQKNISKTNS